MERVANEDAFHVGRYTERVPRVCVLLLIAAGFAVYFNVVLAKMFDFSGSVLIPITIWMSFSALIAAVWEVYCRSVD